MDKKNCKVKVSKKKTFKEAKVSSRKMLGDILHVNVLGLSNSNSCRNKEDGIFIEFLVF